jgi:hypothetical protein
MKSNFLFLLFSFSICSSNYAQSMNVDMIPNIAGVQDTVFSAASGEEFIIEFIGSIFTNVSGYQLKIVFDSTRFDFLGGDADYGMSGKKNILKGNGGSITGIFQRQTNPICDSVIDVAYTINGTTDLSVSGAGLIGIAQFKSKLRSGEIGTIKITDGYIVGFNGIKTSIISYTGGTCYFSPSVAIAYSQRDKLNSYYIESFFTNRLNNNKVEITIYDLKGRLEAVLFNGPISAGQHTVFLPNSGIKPSRGFHICTFQFGSETKTSILFVAN